MSELTSVEDYAVILIWLGIFSFYTTLLTVTALGVAFILRKRRSSILKSQRPPRTPFSELEFHVATPTDTAKSRRVSFSRRTGVAEFVTNEATTTWKNFYEEHNKSLESSGNDSLANHPPKQTVGHLGRRIFDQQFQEIEAVDFMTSLDNHSGRIVNTSLNKANFTQQLASLECTGGDKTLLAPQQNFEMSLFTDHQANVFSEDLVIPTMGEATDRIDVNFSAIQAIGPSEVIDDLDQIQEDMQRVQSNGFCPGPFNGRNDLSEYIEVDLNLTHGTIKNDVCDMSITDIIPSPKVQEVSKSNSLSLDKNARERDWVADKENIALVDGCSPPVRTSEKRKTIVYDNETGNVSMTQSLPANIILPQRNTASEKRRTIVYESDSADISVTQAVPVNIVIVNPNKEKRKTIIYGNETGNISITQAIPSNIIFPDKSNTSTNINMADRNKSLPPEDDIDNVSFTQAVPIAKIISSDVGPKSTSAEDTNSYVPCKDNESLHVSEINNMSITKPIGAMIDVHSPPNVDALMGAIKEKFDVKNKTESVLETNVKFNNITANDNALYSNISGMMGKKFKPSLLKEVPDETKSLMSKCPNETLSMNESLPEQSKVSEKRKTIVYESNSADISVTQAIVIVNLNKEKRKTIIYENDTGNISVTQAIPSNIFFPDKSNTSTNINMADRNKSLPPEDDIDNVSFTQAVPIAKIISSDVGPKPISAEDTNSYVPCKDNESLDISEINNMSITKPIGAMINVHSPHKVDALMGAIKEKFDVNNETEFVLETNVKFNNITSNNKVLYSNISGMMGKNIKPSLLKEVQDETKSSMSKCPNEIQSMNLSLPEQSKVSEKRKTIVYESDSADISVTQAVPANIVIVPDNILVKKDKEKRNTIISNNESGNISMTLPLEDDIYNVSFTQTIPIAKIISNDVPFKSTVVGERNSNVPCKDNDRQRKIIFGNKSLELSQVNNMSITKPIGVVMDVHSPPNVDELMGEITKKFDIKNELVRDTTVKFENKSPYVNAPSGDVSGIIENIIKPSYLKDKPDENKLPMINGVNEILAMNVILPEQSKISEKRRTTVSDSDFANISVTQAVPGNSILDNEDKEKQLNKISEKRRTIVYDSDSANISVTQAVPSNLMLENEDKENQLNKISEKRRTIVYDSDSANISVTQAIPSNLMLDNEDKENQLNIISEKRRTIVYDSDSANISVTQAIPSNLMLDNEDKENQLNKISEKRRTIVYDSDSANISVTQTVPCNLMQEQDKEKRKTIISGSFLENKSIREMSVTSDVNSSSSNLLLGEHSRINSQVQQSILDDMPAEIKSMMTDSISETYAKNFSEITNNKTTDKRRTIVFENDLSDISLNVVLVKENKEKRKTIISNEESGNISMTQAICSNIIMAERKKSFLPEDDIDKVKDIDSVALTQENAKITYSDVGSKVVNAEDTNSKVPCKDNESFDISKINNISINKIGAMIDIHSPPNVDELMGEIVKKIDVTNQSVMDTNVKFDNISFNDNAISGNVSGMVEKDIEPNFLKEVPDETKLQMRKCVNETLSMNVSLSEQSKISEHRTEPVNLMLENDDKENRKTIISEIDTSDISVSQANNTNIISARKYKTIIFEDEPETCADTQTIPTHINSTHIQADLSSSSQIDINIEESNFSSAMASSCKISLEDKLASETSFKSDIQLLPLKKSACGEISYMKKSKDFDESNSTLANSCKVPIEDNLARETSTKTEIQLSPLEKTAFGDISNTKESKDIEESNQSPLKTSYKITFEDKLESDIQPSPLKKTALGEISYVNESKVKVIPGYLKDVSDELKALMTDLVKPNADLIPFSTIDKSKDIPKNPSTCSTQIQANLISSSQIDLNIEETNSASASSGNLGNMSTPSFSNGPKSRKSSLKSPKTVRLPEASICPKLASPSTAISDKVIVFDHNNPLNNVLLVPPDCSNVHRYQPKLNEIYAERNDEKDLEKTPLKESELSGKNVTQFNVESVTFSQVGDTEKIQINESSFSISSKSTSAPEYERVYELKDTKVNTVIAMKENKELLETSSSLTLVDDAITSNNLYVDHGLASEKLGSPSDKKRLSAVQIIYQNDEEEFCKNKSSISTSNDDMRESQKYGSKAKKRIYSPTKRNQHEQSDLTSLENTPKQVSKMQKLSISPNPYKPEKDSEKLEAEKDNSSHDMDVDTSLNVNEISESKTKHKEKSPQKTKPGTNITVQQLITEYELQENIDQDALNKHILEALSKSGSLANTASVTDASAKSPEMASSFTSSKNQIEMHDACSVTTTDTKSSVTSDRSDWRTDPSTSKTLVSECDSSVNVVAKIDMLPFMGSYECEWEPSGSDTWAFRLLHGRLRLTVRLAHRHDNATRTRVRADTPVLAVNLDTVHTDKQNSVAELCVRFASAAMRQHVSRGCSRAGSVVTLVRRCAAVARLATRWGRAVHDARLHLACTLQGDTLALKVANIPLRSVWEVTMRLQLVTDEPVAFPCACDVKVTRVVSDVKITDEEVNKLLATLPRDWGHVPRAIWKIFRYLKNKTRDEDLLGLS
ncbi:hypothetical protein evm_006317 [Chilo suppressalis]|nr:hypothetical protein evm_006317 [Chilo suppressalis]